MASSARTPRPKRRPLPSHAVPRETRQSRKAPISMAFSSGWPKSAVARQSLARSARQSKTRSVRVGSAVTPSGTSMWMSRQPVENSTSASSASAAKIATSMMASARAIRSSRPLRSRVNTRASRNVSIEWHHGCPRNRHDVNRHKGKCRQIDGESGFSEQQPLQASPRMRRSTEASHQRGHSEVGAGMDLSQRAAAGRFIVDPVGTQKQRRNRAKYKQGGDGQCQRRSSKRPARHALAPLPLNGSDPETLIAALRTS